MVSAVGISTLDHLIVVDGFKSREGTYLAKSCTTEGGGMASTALCAAARLGSKTRIFSKIGDDVNGKEILLGFERFSVDTKGIKVLHQANSFVSFVLIDESTGEKQFFHDSKQQTEELKINIDCSLFEGSKVLLVDGHWMEGALEAVKWASLHDVPVVGDFKQLYPGLDKLLSYISYLIIPDFFARSVFRDKEISKVLKNWNVQIKGMTITTNGEKPGWYLQNGELKSFKIYPVKCIDSTGAGDAFHGAFCHFLAQNKPLEYCLDMASRTGALNCRDTGGRKALPTLEEVYSFD